MVETRQRTVARLGMARSELRELPSKLRARDVAQRAGGHLQELMLGNGRERKP